jgi:hypothetical protein
MIWVLRNLDPKVNYRPILSSERALHSKSPVTVKTENKNLVMGSRWEPDTETDWPTDSQS